MAAVSFYPKKQVEELYTKQYEKLAKKDIIYVDDSAHFIMFDKPDWFLKEIQKNGPLSSKTHATGHLFVQPSPSKTHAKPIQDLPKPIRNFIFSDFVFQMRKIIVASTKKKNNVSAATMMIKMKFRFFE